MNYFKAFLLTIDSLYVHVSVSIRITLKVCNTENDHFLLESLVKFLTSPVSWDHI